MHEINDNRTAGAAADPNHTNGGDSNNPVSKRNKCVSKEAVLAKQEDALNWFQGEIELAALQTVRSFVNRYLDVLEQAVEAEVPPETLEAFFERAELPPTSARKIKEIMKTCRAEAAKTSARNPKPRANQSESNPPKTGAKGGVN